MGQKVFTINKYLFIDTDVLVEFKKMSWRRFEKNMVSKSKKKYEKADNLRS